MGRLSSPKLFLGSVALLWVGARMAVGLMGGETGWHDERAQLASVGRNTEPTPAMKDVTAKSRTRSALPVAGWRRGVGHNPVWRFGSAPTDKPDHGATAPLAADGFARGVDAIAASTPVASPLLPSLSSMPLVTIAPNAGLRSTGPPSADRWTLSAWAFGRPMSALTSLGQGLLGGSQAGARGAWRIDRSGRAEIYTRLVSSGRPGDGAEGALGFSLQPVGAVPLRLSVERRQQIVGKGGRSAMAAFVSGGVSAVPLPLRLRLDGYAAAGLVGLRRSDLFAEGSVSVRRAVARIGPVDIDAGVGAWGAVQPDLERIDIGPGISARWRMDSVYPRLSLDWRQRVTGDAAPQSGVALTLATDF